jgi:hypothetical protein
MLQHSWNWFSITSIYQIQGLRGDRTSQPKQDHLMACTKSNQKCVFRAELKSSETGQSRYQILLSRPGNKPAWLKTPWVVFLAPTDQICRLRYWCPVGPPCSLRRPCMVRKHIQKSCLKHFTYFVCIVKHFATFQHGGFAITTEYVVGGGRLLRGLSVCDRSEADMGKGRAAGSGDDDESSDHSPSDASRKTGFVRGRLSNQSHFLLAPSRVVLA